MPPGLQKALRRLGIALFAAWAALFALWVAYEWQDKEGKAAFQHAFLDAADLVRESRLSPRPLVDALDDWADTLPIVIGTPVPVPAPAEDDPSPFGAPRGLKVLHLGNPGYEVGYDESDKLPRWAAYKVFPPVHDLPARPSRFRIDDRTESRVRTELYTHSGFDRGHLAPNYALAVCHGPAAQRASFLMSNVVPQLHALNAGLWRDLEIRIADRFTRRYGEVWVAAGPVFLPEVPARRIGNFEAAIRVPDAFWLVVAERTPAGSLRAFALVIPHDPIWRARDLRPYLVPIDEVERLTGLDLFPDLPEATQRRLESSPAPRVW
jgi:endonuclease G, mitochondrial